MVQTVQEPASPCIELFFENWAIDDAVKEMKQGGYGYHIIWKNIDRLFTPENVKWIQQQLSNPS